MKSKVVSRASGRVGFRANRGIPAKPRVRPQKENVLARRSGRPTKARRIESGLRATTWPPQAALDVLLDGVVSFLIDAGFDKDRLAGKLRQTARRIGAGAVISKRRSSEYETMMRVCGVVHDWCWHSAYIDAETGKPRSLWLDKGDHSLRELIKMRFRDEEVEEILLWMELNGVVARQLDGSFSLTRRGVLVDDYPPLALERITTIVTQYLETGLHNLRTRNSAYRNVDRTAWVSHLPEKYLPQFREMLREQTQAFLEIVDTWLESRNSPTSNEPTIEAGVHSYIYVGIASRSRRMTRAPTAVRKDE